MQTQFAYGYLVSYSQVTYHLIYVDVMLSVICKVKGLLNHRSVPVKMSLNVRKAWKIILTRKRLVKFEIEMCMK